MTNFVRIRFGLFPGEIHWSSVEYPDSSPSDPDSINFWLDEEDIQEGAVESPSGIFIRESAEHGYLWFPKPEGVCSIGIHERVVYASYEKANGWQAYALPFMQFLVDGSPGARILSKKKIDWVFQNQFLMSGAHRSELEAIEDLKNSIRP